MDKSYLLHNLKIVDNAEEDHGMLDLEFQNIRYENRDLIADVIETARYVGEVNPRTFITKHNDVSLTGAGGGSGGFKIVSITAVNESTATVKITCPQLYSDPTHIYSGEITIMRGTTKQFNTIVPIADGDGYTTISMPTVPNDFTDGIQQSGPTFKITENASNETITWG